MFWLGSGAANGGFFMAISNANLAYLLDPAFQIEGNSGKPLVGGWIEIYLAGTNTKYISYQNFDGTKNPFKVPLGSDGRAVILVEDNEAYDVYFYDSFGNLAFSRLNVTPSKGTGGGGLSEVIHDWTLTGKGNTLVPLGVKNYLNLAVDKSMTAYSGVVSNKNSLILGVDENWLSSFIGIKGTGYVTWPSLYSYSAEVDNKLSTKVDTDTLSGYMTTSELFDTFLTKGSFDENIDNYYQKTETSSKYELDEAFNNVAILGQGTIVSSHGNSGLDDISAYRTLGLYEQVEAPSSCLIVGTNLYDEKRWLGYTMPSAYTDVSSQLANREEKVIKYNMGLYGDKTYRLTAYGLNTNAEGKYPREVWGHMRLAIDNSQVAICPASSNYRRYWDSTQERWAYDESHTDIIHGYQCINFNDLTPNWTETLYFSFSSNKNDISYIALKDGSSATNFSASNIIFHCKY